MIFIHKPGEKNNEPIEAKYGIDFVVGDETFNIKIDEASKRLVIRKSYDSINIIPCVTNQIELF